MNKTFFVDIDKLSPTHYYLSREKLSKVQKHFETHSLEDYPPLPVMRLGKSILLVGGHHYAYYIYKQGKHIAEVFDAEDDENFMLHIKYHNDCIRKNIITIKGLQNRVLKKEAYAQKWQQPFEENTLKINKNSIAKLKTQIVIKEELKLEIVHDILDYMPPYFANEFMFENYIKKIENMHFLAFNLYNKTVAFAVCKKLYENTIEIYMLGIFEQMLNTDIADKIINAVKRYTKSINRKYITVKVPIKTAVRNNAYALFDFYLNQGFSHIANLQAPWDEKRICMLLIKH